VEEVKCSSFEETKFIENKMDQESYVEDGKK
jgi:hypothetical protein